MLLSRLYVHHSLYDGSLDAKLLGHLPVSLLGKGCKRRVCMQQRTVGPFMRMHRRLLLLLIDIETEGL